MWEDYCGGDYLRSQAVSSLEKRYEVSHKPLGWLQNVSHGHETLYTKVTKNPDSGIFTFWYGIQLVGCKSFRVLVTPSAVRAFLKREYRARLRVVPCLLTPSYPRHMRAVLEVHRLYGYISTGTYRCPPPSEHHAVLPRRLLAHS